ncbi:GDCCVxC domain-containing (seleno)protein [Rhizobium sp. P32RR-XVIII]|uniref:GDCCVxC domain-containing (seleno)protein n=1 Tax=Rhizobium sp. P32RR-XVIII TaxID=2726738 RepID=UPI001FEFD72D|nr:GDCCVxC domain-containing (seleno)protein [Rhizobium sp. P32RR-XVIII]
MTIFHRSTITCPECGHRALEAMPTDACQYFYDCKGCGAVLRPKVGDCCVYCSYGDIPCPPVQAARDNEIDAGNCHCC